MFMLIYTPVTVFWPGINNLQLYILNVTNSIKEFNYHLESTVSLEPLKTGANNAVLR